MGRAKIICRYILIFTLSLVSNINFGTDVHASQAAVKNVLIINSYHKGITWTDDETDGIVDILKETREYSISVEYMDWKNYPYEENIKKFRSHLQYKYAQKKIDIIVTTDDAALEFALKYRSEIFFNAPVVFCGVNENGIKKITKGHTNVTGVVEEVDPKSTVQAALEINPQLENIYVVFDNTESGLSTGDLTIEAIHHLSPRINAIPLNKGRYTEILDRVEKISGNSIILITTYYSDSEGIIVGFEDFSQAISEKSHVPVYHLYDFGIGNGAFGGSMLSGRLQGQVAGKLAQRILSGENISQIAVARTKTTRYIFDYTQLQRFHIPLSRIPKGSRIVNKPFSFFETYKELVITVTIIFALLVVFICILLFNLNKINRMKRELYNSNIELKQLYEELTESDQKLKRQYDALEQAQRNLAESEEQYSLLFKKMLNGFCVIEPVLDKNKRLSDIRFITVNPSFERHTGKKADFLVGKTWAEAFASPNRNLSFYQQILETGLSTHFETYYPQIDTHFLINAFKISEKRIGLVIDNITEYKQAIREIRNLNEELETRVEERTNELQSAVRELEAFVYTVSHDLKSPLRAVDGYSRIFLEDFGGRMDHEANKIILSIRSICKEMIEMINKLLQYSTTSRAALNLEEVGMETMIKNIFKEISSSYPDRNIELKIETGLPDVIVDKTLFSQVLWNLLSNAVKFTKERVNALISVGSTITESEYVFYLKDNGIGFHMNYAEKLFGLFQRLHTSDEYEGSGIGLVTVKKIVEKHGGKVWIEGKPDEGATVYFTLPFVWQESNYSQGR